MTTTIANAAALSTPTSCVLLITAYELSLLFFTGTFAVLSIMVGIVCMQLAPESNYSYFNTTINATVVHIQKMNEARLAISGTLACLTAIIQVIDQKRS